MDSDLRCRCRVVSQLVAAVALESGHERPRWRKSAECLSCVCDVLASIFGGQNLIDHFNGRDGRRRIAPEYDAVRPDKGQWMKLRYDWSSRSRSTRDSLRSSSQLSPLNSPNPQAATVFSTGCSKTPGAIRCSLNHTYCTNRMRPPLMMSSKMSVRRCS